MDDWWIYPLVFVAALASSWVGALVGGGSLIITSVLLSLGIPGTILVGSRRTAAIGGNVGSWLVYHKQKKVDYKLGLILFPVSLLGLFIGWYFLEALKDKGLEQVIAIILLVLLGFKMLKDFYGNHMTLANSRVGRHIGGGLGALLSGLVNNLTGAGGGMVLVFGLLLGYGKEIIHAAGTAKFVLILSNAAAAIMFTVVGYVHWKLVAVMIVGHFIGGWLGAKFFVKRDEKFLRWVFYFLVVFLVVRTFLSG